MQSCSDHFAAESYELHLLLGFNDDDDFWRSHAEQFKKKTPYFLRPTYLFMPLPRVVREGKTVTNMINITNTLVQKAYAENADYIVRVNDDTEFVSKGWLSEAVKKLRSYDPPNVGVVGPLCHEGNTGILTHDMIHRTHMEIFETYWPTYFVNWYGDTWITDVYKKANRLTVLPVWLVRHNIHRHGTRYEPFSPSREKYEFLVNVGAERIIKHLASKGVMPKQAQESCNAKCKMTPPPKKVIAYSLYGNNPRYLDVVDRTVKDAHRVYPEWTVRVFVPAEYDVSPLQKHNMDVCVVTGTKCPDPMWFRMYFMNDSPADYTLVRDLDSLLTKREARAVDAWIASGRPMHVMRDSKDGHDHAINGGMFGVHNSGGINWRSILNAHLKGRGYGADLNVLASAVFGKAIPKSSILQHDSHTCVKWGAQPFPDNDLDDGKHYVGESVRKDGTNHFNPSGKLSVMWDPPAECIPPRTSKAGENTFVAFTSTRPVHMLVKKEIKDQVAYIKSAEGQLWAHMTASLEKLCKYPNAMFVDSGANEGTWSLMAASYGCRVIAVEPQPLCVKWLQREVEINQMQDLVSVHNNVLSNAKFSVAVNDNSCSGTSQYRSDGSVVDAFDVKVPVLKTQDVNAIQISALVPTEAVVVMWHLDTEGAEIPVLRSAQSLLEKKRICQIIVEWLPAQWDKFDVGTDEGAAEAQTLLQNFACTNGCGKVANFRQKQGGGGSCNSHRDIYCVLRDPPAECHGQKSA